MSKSKFSSQEWQLITDGPEWVFAALAAADGNVALAVKAKESKAFKKAVQDYASASPLDERSFLRRLASGVRK